MKNMVTINESEAFNLMATTAEVTALTKVAAAVAEATVVAVATETTAAVTAAAAAAAEAIASNAQTDATSELDIVINNVVCSFSVRCHLKLREIALHGANVEYRRENGMVTMRLRRPYTTASIWSSGRVTCTGAISEPQAKVAARRYARSLGKLGFPVHFQNFRIVNVLGTCSMPWSIKIVSFSERHRSNASYEPELHPGVTYKMCDPKATMKIFSTGSITVTAASVNAVESAIQRLYPLVHEFRTRPVVKEPQPEIDDGKASKDSVTLRPGQNKHPAMVAGITIPMTVVKSGMRREQPTPPPRSCNTSDNICGNARRRATECWASKLQVKRPRYNDASSIATVTASNLARSVSGHAQLRRKPASMAHGKSQTANFDDLNCMEAFNLSQETETELDCQINDASEEVDDAHLHW